MTFIMGSLLLAIMALIVRIIEADKSLPLQAFLIFGSLLTAMGAVSLRLQAASWNFDERVRSSAIAVGAALIGIVDYFVMGKHPGWAEGFSFGRLNEIVKQMAIEPEWDSLRLAVRIFALV